MKNMSKKYFTAMILAAFVVFACGEAFARAGGSRSFGSRGSRSVAPSRSYQSSPARPAQTAPAPSQSPQAAVPPSQPASGGFFRGLAGGVLGGMLGSMLFGSLIGGMPGMFGGVGLLDIIVLAAVVFLLFRVLGSRRQSPQPSADAQVYAQPAASPEPPADDINRGIAAIRQMDPGFDPSRFSDWAMDAFFKIQSGWMNRDTASLRVLVTDEMERLLSADIESLRREGRTNRLENIAMRSVDIVEAWQESGQDFCTVRVYANLLDYTTDDRTGAVISGSRTEPVKFEEYWTFTRPVGPNAWRLSAIEQAA